MITTRKKIMGRDINFSIDDIDEIYFDRIVGFINEKWLEVKNENVCVPDTQKIAALTAVKIVVELFKLGDLQKNILNNYESKIKELIMHLDEYDHQK
ncbi:MAG: cell division protein ZapA [Endomicrobium sp.]|jgi:cell division protein ZapA (FtsZ GTPase activity inhibitor)|nr:cell division protein ZapA [Endomicrobium sp.]